MPTTMNPRHAENMLEKAIRLKAHLEVNGVPELADTLNRMAAASATDESRAAAVYLRAAVSRYAGETTPYSPATVAQAARLIQIAEQEANGPVFEGLPQ